MPSARKLLGQHLHDLRKAARLEQTALSEQLRVTQASVSRFERATRPIRAELLHAWLDITAADDQQRARAIELFDRAGTEVTSWETLQSRGWDAHQRRYEELERAAEVVRCYQPSLVPGLLQTAEYAEALMRQVLRKPEDEIATDVAARLRRGGNMWQGAVQLDVIVAEHVLRTRFCGGAMMPGQLRQIAAAAALPNVDLAVIPTLTDMPAPWGHSYELYELPPPDDPFVTVELVHGEPDPDAPDIVKRYREKHELYRQHAVTGQDAIDLVLSIAADHERH